MSVETGYVNSISARDTSAGTMYDIVINGEKIGAGKYPPKVTENDYVQYEIEMNGRWKNLKRNSVKVLDAPKDAPAPKPVKKYSGGDNRQEVISRQSALNTAVSFIALLSQADALPFSKSAKSDVKADKMEEILVMYTNKIHRWNTHEDFDFGGTFDDNGHLNLNDLEDQEVWEE